MAPPRRVVWVKPLHDGSSSPVVRQHTAAQSTGRWARHPGGSVPLRMLAIILHQTSSDGHALLEFCPTKSCANRRSAVAIHLNCRRGIHVLAAGLNQLVLEHLSMSPSPFSRALVVNPPFDRTCAAQEPVLPSPQCAANVRSPNSSHKPIQSHRPGPLQELRDLLLPSDPSAAEQGPVRRERRACVRQSMCNHGLRVKSGQATKKIKTCDVFEGKPIACNVSPRHGGNARNDSPIPSLGSPASCFPTVA